MEVVLNEQNTCLSDQVDVIQVNEPFALQDAFGYLVATIYGEEIHELGIKWI